MAVQRTKLGRSRQIGRTVGPSAAIFTTTNARNVGWRSWLEGRSAAPAFAIGGAAQPGESVRARIGCADSWPAHEMLPIAGPLSSDGCNARCGWAIWRGVTCRPRIGGCFRALGQSSAAWSTGRWGPMFDELLVSAGHPGLLARSRAGLDRAVGVWIDRLRVVVIDAGHPALAGLDDRSYRR